MYRCPYALSGMWLGLTLSSSAASLMHSPTHDQSWCPSAPAHSSLCHPGRRANTIQNTSLIICASSWWREYAGDICTMATRSPAIFIGVVTFWGGYSVTIILLHLPPPPYSVESFVFTNVVTTNQWTWFPRFCQVSTVFDDTGSRFLPGTEWTNSPAHLVYSET